MLQQLHINTDMEARTLAWTEFTEAIPQWAQLTEQERFLMEHTFIYCWATLSAKVFKTIAS